MTSWRSYLAAAALACAAGAPAAAVELKHNNWMPPRSLEGTMLPKFADELAKATGGQVTMKVFSGGQLLGARETLGGIRDGVIDIGFISPNVNAAELPHSSMIPDLLPFGREGLSAGAAADETIMVNCKECQEEYAKQNAVWLGGFGPPPWKFMCKDPIASLADIKGRKARVTGGMATRMITAIGGVGVSMNPPEISQAMQRGQIDCTFGPIDWMITLRLKDAVKVVMDEHIGTFHGLGLFVMNKNSLAKLTADQRAVLKRMIPEWMAAHTLDYQRRAVEVTKQLEGEGVKFWKPTADVVDALQKFRDGEVAAVAADARQRGVKDPESIIRQHLATLKKWEKIVDEVKGEEKAYAAALSRQIYDKVAF